MCMLPTMYKMQALYIMPRKNFIKSFLLFYYLIKNKLYDTTRLKDSLNGIYWKLENINPFSNITNSKEFSRYMLFIEFRVLKK